MLMVLDSLIPVLAVIATGWATRAVGFISEAEWRGAEQVTFHVLIPGLMIHTLAASDLTAAPVGRLVLVLLLPALAVAGLTLALRKPLEAAGYGGPAFTSIFQGAVRWNSFVALGLAGALYGREGVATCAVAFAVLIPFVNFVSLAVIGRYGAERKPFRLVPFTATLLKNPFIWSTLVGLAIQILAIPMPKMALVYADILGKAVLACGLLVVGAGLDLRALQKPSLGLAVPAGLKLLVLPALAGLLGNAIGLTGAALAVPIIAAAAPTAAAAYILARQNGGDAPLMAAIITAETILAALTIPLMLALFAP